MNNIPENFNNLKSKTNPDLNIFPFLKKRYTRGFFNKFINGYFLFLLEDSNRFLWNASDTFDKFLAKVFNPELVEDKCYSTYFLHTFIYDGPQMLKESNELTVIDNADKFLLTAKYAHLDELKFGIDEIRNELLRQTGLLVIHARMNFRAPTQPRFITTMQDGIDFCDTGTIKNSLLKYKTECSNALERADKIIPFGRIYTPIVNEYFGFLDFTIKKFHNLLTQELKDILNKWHQQYKLGKIEAGKGPQSIAGPLHYLQGSPPGSAQKK